MFHEKTKKVGTFLERTFVAGHEQTSTELGLPQQLIGY